ncbi:hypothetical protein AVEN_232083-1 [Araneus ventricosus]|uniref:Uncharacterized protein n=1 Tax=Araneus ventricosus TaxID=182803 RepID=A0A4Y2S7J4_ARAVE|nr:hypothetical protein AVEN_232083-1 [Araneus ventricosus]
MRHSDDILIRTIPQQHGSCFIISKMGGMVQNFVRPENLLENNWIVVIYQFRKGLRNETVEHPWRRRNQYDKPVRLKIIKTVSFSQKEKFGAVAYSADQQDGSERDKFGWDECGIIMST